MSKSKIELPRNCEIERFEDDEDRSFRLRFQQESGQDYVSEIYTPRKGEHTRRAAYNVCRRFGWLDKPPGTKEKEDERIIHNLREFLDWRGCGDNPYSWARAYYKYTSCGPWVVFLEEDTPAKDVEHPPLVARIRCVGGQAKVLNPEALDDKFVQFLGFDKQGLSKKERTWDNYLKLVDDYVANEAKQTRTGRSITIEKRTVAEIHIRQPGSVEHFEAKHREIYYEDIGNTKYKDEPIQVPCGCTLHPSGPHPDDPQEEIYTTKEPDPDCRVCRGTGVKDQRVPETRPTPGGGMEIVKIQVDFDKCVGLKFGSIVEGSEVCSGPFTHMFPFKASDWTRDEEYMEGETSYYWERDNYTWFKVHVCGEDYYCHATWGDGVKWDSPKPSPKLRRKIERCIEENYDDIPRQPGTWARPQPDWKPLRIFGTRAYIEEYVNDGEF